MAFFHLYERQKCAPIMVRDETPVMLTQPGFKSDLSAGMSIAISQMSTSIHAFSRHPQVEPSPRIVHVDSRRSSLDGETRVSYKKSY